MKIESFTPLVVKTKTGEVQLAPGRPMEFSDEDGRKLLAKAAGKVRVVPAVTPTEWLAEWRALAALTDGLRREDPRYGPVMAALGLCDDAFAQGDCGSFQAAARRVRDAVAGPSAKRGNVIK